MSICICQEALILESVKTHFPPEFVNRIDEVVCFRSLGWNDMRPIMQLQLNGVQNLLSDRQITLKYNEQTIAWLCQKGFDPAYGARPLKRAIQNEVLHPLSQAILRGDVKDGSTVELKIIQDAVTFEIEAGNSSVSSGTPSRG